MVAKKKRTQRGKQAIVSLHLEARRRHDELLEEAQNLQAAGKVREARVVLKTAEFMQAHLAALEEEQQHGAS